MNHVAGSFTVNYTMEVVVPDVEYQGGTIPYEARGQDRRLLPWL